LLIQLGHEPLGNTVGSTRQSVKFTLLEDIANTPLPVVKIQ
jgi:hypothetical protein